MTDYSPEYAAGFSDGEAQAYRDRQGDIRRERTPITSPFARGWWDGYTPRSLTWARLPAPSWPREGVLCV